MLLSKSGIVINPYSYKGWYAEITGDAENTGGFYIIISNREEQLLYWDISELLVNQQILNDNIEIKWFD